MFNVRCSSVGKAKGLCKYKYLMANTLWLSAYMGFIAASHQSWKYKMVMMIQICSSVHLLHWYIALIHWYNFKILPEHQLQNLEQTLKPYPQSPNKNVTLWPKLIFQICTKLLSTCFSSSTSTTVTTSTSFEWASSHARLTSIKFTKRQWVSEWVS